MSRDWQQIKLLREIAGVPAAAPPRRLDIPTKYYVVECKWCGYSSSAAPIAEHVFNTYQHSECRDKYPSWKILYQVLRGANGRGWIKVD